MDWCPIQIFLDKSSYVQSNWVLPPIKWLGQHELKTVHWQQANCSLLTEELNTRFACFLFLRTSKHGGANAADDSTQRHGTTRTPGRRMEEDALSVLNFAVRHLQTQLKVCCWLTELWRWDETTAKRPGWPRDAWHEHVSSVYLWRYEEYAELMLLTCWGSQSHKGSSSYTAACFPS